MPPFLNLILGNTTNSLSYFPKKVKTFCLENLDSDAKKQFWKKAENRIKQVLDELFLLCYISKAVFCGRMPENGLNEAKTARGCLFAEELKEVEKCE